MASQAPYTTRLCHTESEWRDFRKQGIGGSDAPVIMGDSPYKSPFILWLEKTGQQKPADLTDKPAVEWGHRLEAVVANKFADEHPDWQIRKKNLSLISKKYPWMHANLDRTIKTSNGVRGVLEIKTTTSYRAEDWTDGVPAYYYAQPLHYLAVTGYDFMCVAVLIGGQDYREYTFQRDDKAIERLIEAEDTFWNHNVKNNIAPELQGIENEFPYFTNKNDSTSITLTNTDLVDELVKVKAQLKDTEAQKKKLELQILQLMGNHNKAVCGNTYITARRTLRNSVDYKRYAQDNPGCFDDYTTQKDVFGGLRLKVKS